MKYLVALFTLATPVCMAAVFPDIGYQPPADWSDAKFVLSQSYPQTKPPAESYPWAVVDFKTKPAEYLRAVLSYCFEGNIEANFVPQNNAKRKWYHVPWLHYGPNGREFVSGLTRERGSRPFELSPKQIQQYRNYAVGFYSEQGGFTIGQVWKDSGAPKIDGVSFGEGTVAFKLLFTTAPVSEVDFLNGSPEWTADINRSQKVDEIKSTKVRLLQIDVAVRDARSNCGGWIFGTFHYDSSMPGASPWDKLRPLALLWGNDPDLTETKFNGGQKPVESWVNEESPIVKYRSNPPQGATPPKVLGWAGRGNGPVDNPVSSCLSCHATAQIPALSPMTPPATNAESQKLRWFRNLPPDTAFDSAAKTLDFSLQLGVGIQNFQQFQNFVANSGGVFTTTPKGIALFMNSPNSPVKTRRDISPQQYRFSRDPEQ